MIWGSLKEAAAAQHPEFSLADAHSEVTSIGRAPWSGRLFTCASYGWNLDAETHKNRDAPKLVVLDDDPTGCQTVKDIEIISEWAVDTLTAHLKAAPPGFFILTNSRALPADEASVLIQEICCNLKQATQVAGVPFCVVLRTDSTLRGHFPEEPRAAQAELGVFDAWLLVPFFLQGGRYTIDDTHYVADGDTLVPAAETEFAKDSAFGYSFSNMTEYVQEKSCGEVKAEDVHSLSLAVIRQQGPAGVCEWLLGLPQGVVAVVNAMAESDMAVVAAGVLRAELQGKRYLFRTSASFVSSRLAIPILAPIRPKELPLPYSPNGGLIVVGSHVQKTTAQVEVLVKECGDLKVIELDVKSLILIDAPERTTTIQKAIESCIDRIINGQTVLLMTSRKLLAGQTAEESLRLSSSVSDALVQIVQGIPIRPRYILAKGGITSSDVATKGCGVKQATIVGQAAPGVPVWELGKGSRFPGVPYIVFPGNVGGVETLAKVAAEWREGCARGTHSINVRGMHISGRHVTTRQILEKASKEGYAVGAFNIYNMEGALAIKEAAERCGSPAIIQILPAALRHGGDVLLAACMAAARTATVPITVHLDHASSMEDIEKAVNGGVHSVLADFSHLPLEVNQRQTTIATAFAHHHHVEVEAEIGRLGGFEDGMSVEEYEAQFTDPARADTFVKATKVDFLAVCIGNVHGQYPPGPVNLDLKRLELIRTNVGTEVLLVLHGVSGLSSTIVKDCIKRGVCKLNVNTEVRKAYVQSLQSDKAQTIGTRRDLLAMMSEGQAAMAAIIENKMQQFGSAGKA